MAGLGSPLDVADAPVLQVALSGSSRELWAKSDRGLSPPDLAIHVVLPELDGRLFAGVASFKQVETADPELGYARTVHRGDDDRIAAIVARARAWIALRRTAQADKRLAIVLSAYPGRDDQMAHAVGLDAPESTVEALTILRERGYAIADTPADGAALIDRLKTAEIRWPLETYRAALAGLDPALVADLEAQWGAPESDPAISGGDFVFKATYCGNVLVAVQPDRGRRADRAAEYHDPRRSPRHGYVAFYLWLRQAARCDALIHMGAHGTLEWLPGKSVALSSACWPDALLGPTPVIYPFIVNNPGEAATAKRRLGAVTIGHMTPPISTGALPKGLQAIERLLDEYSVADGLDPRRRERLAQAIVEAARESGLDRDSGLAEAMTPLESVVRLDSFVCDVKDTLVADGLHIFGRVPMHTGRCRNPVRGLCGRRTRRAARRARRQACRAGTCRLAMARAARRAADRPQSLHRRYPRGAEPHRHRTGQGSRRCLADPPSPGPRRLSAQRDARSLGIGDDAHRRRGVRHGAAVDGRRAGVGHHIRPGHGL